MAGGLKFRIYEVEGLYHPCSEKKGADQLHRYREADLRLCFPICKKPVFSRRGSYLSHNMRKPAFCICKNKGADQLCSHCAADQCLCFRYIYKLQSLNYQNQKLQASSHCLWLYRSVCVGPDRKPRRQVFS